MSVSLILVCLWVVIANVAAMRPARDNHWGLAWALIVTGIPLLGYVTLQHGPWMGLLILGAGASILRWPLIRLGQRLRDRLDDSGGAGV